ncbi:NADP-dependent oxidoreductase [Aquibium microcysteis]|uniref:NADP-dependent oxidoreductase n=1 Tax=Aquibium microcysteis TaxID=675281 RepID=UPI00165D0E3D|nr:NADP-dependent oxidoreductase [Aquibium microcysteis]
MSETNRRWLLARRPQGRAAESDFAFDSQPYAPPELAEGEVLVRTKVFSCAPTMRNWMNEPGRSYRASIGIGEPIIGVSAGIVEKSRHPRHPVGSKIAAVMHWQDFCLVRPDQSPTPVLRIPDDSPIEDALGIFGLNALTAYFGMLRVGQPKPGETVVVSGAAGSTGSVAAQVARNVGCRVIGIAGGADKCSRLLTELKLDGAIDYKSEDVSKRLGELCPKGVDVFYDNVGGDILQAVMENVAVHARIAVCGQVAAYDTDKPAPGPRDMMKLVYWRVRIQGFVMGDYAHDADAALAELKRWRDEGKLIYRTDMREGFESLPRTFLDLFIGANDGALLVRT